MFHKEKVSIYRQVVYKWINIFFKFLKNEPFEFSDDCIYCEKFAKNNPKVLCGGCPLAISGDAECMSTPFYDFQENPSAETSFNMLEFVWLNPPEGVKVGEGL